MLADLPLSPLVARSVDGYAANRIGEVLGRDVVALEVVRVLVADAVACGLLPLRRCIAELEWNRQRAALGDEATRRCVGSERAVRLRRSSEVRDGLNLCRLFGRLLLFKTSFDFLRPSQERSERPVRFRPGCSCAPPTTRGYLERSRPASLARGINLCAHAQLADHCVRPHPSARHLH